MTKKRFRAHDNLIVDVIKRQSGSLGKAILEGVMNSVDAGGQKIEITLDPSRLVITDDGRGFRSEQEIDDWFAVFGQPHEKDDLGEVKDAKYGEFRMGRGQLFAFGTNTWSTNAHQIKVDINTMGLDFDLMPLIHPVPGCKVEVDLYARLTASELLSYTNEITKYCKYVDVPVFLNKKQINTPPADCSWTEVTDDAYIKVKEEGTTGVEFYQQGVFVENIPSYQIGACGVIVTKKRVQLNFARNQVMRSDTRFKRIMTKFSSDNEKRINAKKTLSDDEAISLLSRISTGATNWDANRAAKLFPDTTGRRWSLNTLARLPGQETFSVLPNGKLGYCFAAKGSLVADRVMQRMNGLVFDERVLGWLGLTKPEEFVTLMGWRMPDGFQLTTLAKLSADAVTFHHLIPIKHQTPTETRVLEALQCVVHGVERTRRIVMGEDSFGRWKDQRVLRIGKSDASLAWTDGSTFVAFNRTYLARVGTMLPGWVDMARLLVHEICHTDDDTKTHEHNEQFYRLFHDILGHSNGQEYGRLVIRAYQHYVRKTEEDAGKLHKRQQAATAKEKATIENEKFLAQHENVGQKLDAA